MIIIKLWEKFHAANSILCSNLEIQWDGERDTRWDEFMHYVTIKRWKNERIQCCTKLSNFYAKKKLKLCRSTRVWVSAWWEKNHTSQKWRTSWTDHKLKKKQDEKNVITAELNINEQLKKLHEKGELEDLYKTVKSTGTQPSRLYALAEAHKENGCRKKSPRNKS